MTFADFEQNIRTLSIPEALMHYAIDIGKAGSDDDRHGIYTYLSSEQSRYAEIDNKFDAFADQVITAADAAYPA